ncbi:hypothetical protein TIFTF001_014852 [Ficus carica]|uniref:Uncharacterized protein n=1 Tax=Ficus carica TaxID=3494 RepID=A0AA87ZXM7_FICCA|nr:hypothetical protein TIFTF001_014852 [Ficus carica]
MTTEWKEMWYVQYWVVYVRTSTLDGEATRASPSDEGGKMVRSSMEWDGVGANGELW